MTPGAFRRDQTHFIHESCYGGQMTIAQAVDQKLHDIGSSGPVVLEPDYSKLKVVGLTRDVAESHVPMNITVSYAGQDGTARPFLMIINWLRVGKDWKVASEIILPVPPAPAAKG